MMIKIVKVHSISEYPHVTKKLVSIHQNILQTN